LIFSKKSKRRGGEESMSSESQEREALEKKLEEKIEELKKELEAIKTRVSYLEKKI
jgi:uncharacterized FlaG/YvyC family protein